MWDGGFYAPHMKPNPKSFFSILAVLSALQICVTVSAAEKKPLPSLKPADLQKVEAALPGSASAKPAKARKILVFSRCEGFVHGDGIVVGNKAIELMGQKTGAYTTDFSEDYAAFEPDNLAKYDAIILNNTTQLKFPDDTKKKAFLDFVKNGKGMIGIHAATDNFYDWPEAASMLGGLFDGHPWNANGTWAFKLDDPKHPLNQAFEGKGFKIKDEIYQFKDPYTRADRTVLVTLDLSDPVTGGIKNGVKRTDGDFALAWIKKFGQGRVFFCGFGHAGNVFQEPAMLRFLLDGTQYALGDFKVKD